MPQSSKVGNSLKYADVKTVFKKDSRDEKENFKPVSILPSLSKV